MHEALLYDKLKDPSRGKAGKKVKCNLCNHHCLINVGKRGICGVRENKDGKLYSLVYGKAVAENIDPIEKKPLYHFLPGTFSLSIATVGCNFRCIHCQNAEISQITKEKPEDVEILGKDLPPEKVVKHALDNNCPSISYTYTEPTIFLEYALDCMKLAKDKGLKNIWVSNGYMTTEALDLIAPYLDAINVDLKAFTEKFYQEICGARLEPVLDTLTRLASTSNARFAESRRASRDGKIHLEVTTLIIPEKNDSEKELKKITEFIKKELGINTPWHVSRFFPYYKLDHIPPTPVGKIHQAVEIGKKAGLKYVYAGNI